MGVQLDLFAAVHEAERRAFEARQVERDKETRAQRLRAVHQLQADEVPARPDVHAPELPHAPDVHAPDDLLPPEADEECAFDVRVPAYLSHARRRAWIELCRAEAEQRQASDTPTDDSPKP